VYILSIKRSGDEIKLSLVTSQMAYYSLVYRGPGKCPEEENVPCFTVFVRNLGISSTHATGKVK
jgi:hypothetical protein